MPYDWVESKVLEEPGGLEVNEGPSSSSYLGVDDRVANAQKDGCRNEHLEPVPWLQEEQETVRYFFFFVDFYLPCSESPKGANNASTFQRKVFSFDLSQDKNFSSFRNSLFLSTLTSL